MPRPLLVLLLTPVLLATCGSVFKGPLFGSISLERPADAGDAVAFLRCRGPAFHGEMQTDAEETRVGVDGRFIFAGSLTLPNTTHCSLQIRHPRYLTAHIPLDNALIQRLDTVVMQSWDNFFAAGSPYELNPGTHRPWPESEVRRHLTDTVTWLRTFGTRDQHRMVGYVPDIHAIYRQARAQLTRPGDGWPNMLKSIATIEEITAYRYPFNRYLEAVMSGDADTVEAYIAGGVLRETLYRRQKSMLYLAAAGGHLEVIAVLLANDEPLNIAGCSAPLLGAIAHNQWLAAQALIRAGANIDTGCPANHRGVGDVLREFVRSEQLDLLNAFLDAGTPVDTRDSRGTTALAEAVSGGHIQVVKVLLAAGANPKEHTAGKVTLLVAAREKGYLDIERELRLAMGEEQLAQVPPPGNGKIISLPWRLGETQPYRIHTSFGQVLNMAADPREPGVLWLATWGGLLRVDPASGERRSWTRADGLPASTVQNLWFDSAGEYLWLVSSGSLARLPLNELARVETIGEGGLRTSFASGFLHGNNPDTTWFWGNNGLYQLDVENSRALYYALPETPFGAASHQGGKRFYISDKTTLWRFNPATGERTQVLDAAALGTLTPRGPRGLPELGWLTVDEAQGYLWIGSFRHGVFRLDIEDGDVTRPLMTDEQVATCARTTVTPHMQGQVKRAAGQTFAQLERCFGRINEDDLFERIRPRIDAGPVADAKDNIWYIADNSFYRVDPNGKLASFPRAIDPLGNAQARAVEHVGDQLLVSFSRGPKSVLNLKSRTWSTVDQQQKKIVPAKGRHETVDPDAPELTWHVQSDTIFLKSNGRLIHRWPAKLDLGEIMVIRDKNTTVWIASGVGLIEFPISESLSELRAFSEPQQTPTTPGRSPR